jgi:erythromycin esterase-like protein
VRSLAPADADFSDLEFLREEIGTARVVMLGEPTHGEGNVFEAKARLLRFLQQRMGFTTLVMESGFYELDRAQRAVEAGVPVREAIDASVFPVWTSTQEFQAVLPLLGQGGLRVAGFDCQLTGEYREELLEELESFLKPEKGAAGIMYDYLDECLSVMGESFIFPPTHQLPLFELQLGKARGLLAQVAAGPDAERRQRAAFWLQTLRSLQALARDYAAHDPSAKSAAEFKAADSNPRDAQMADNLLWYLRQHPQEKVVCWGALPHLANKVEALDDAEIQAYRPMGRAVKAALGADAVYVLGTLAGGGSHGFAGLGGYEPVPTPAPGTLEAELLAQGRELGFVSLKHDAPGQVLTTYAFEYRPLRGVWSEVVDGFLFLRSVNPPHGAVLAAEAVGARPAADEEPPAAGRLNPAVRTGTVAAKAGHWSLQGVVLDARSGQPVPFATVAVPARVAGTVADAQGRFALAVQPGELVQVSSLGYEPATVGSGKQRLTVRLRPTAYALGPVRVSAASQNPRHIMRRVIKAAATNYEQQDYRVQIYTHRRVTNFDTLHAELEQVSEMRVPAGARRWAGGFLMLGARPTSRTLEQHEIVPLPKTRPGMGSRDLGYIEGGHGFSGGFDPVRISPLFKLGTLGKYTLNLDSIEQHGTETYYLISFAAKRPTHRSTDQYHIAGYSGRVRVRQRGYAVLHYEALWQHDTLLHNAVARKYRGRNNLTARLYSQQYSDKRTSHVVRYAQQAGGRYRVSSSVAQSLSIGRTLTGQPFYVQKYCEVYPGVPAVETPATGQPRPEEPPQTGPVPYRPEFWQTYQRPTPAHPAPELRATRP